MEENKMSTEVDLGDRMKEDLYMGTSATPLDIYYVLRDLDFNRFIDEGRVNLEEDYTMQHEWCDDIDINVYLDGCEVDQEDVLSHIIFNMGSGRFPQYPQALRILREMDRRIPDMVYLDKRMYYGIPNMDSDTRRKVSTRPLSDLLEELKELGEV